MTEGWTGSLVKLGVDGNLKVIVVEVGRLVQYGQNILDDSGETTQGYSERKKEAGVCGEAVKLASLTGNMSWFP